MYCEATWVVLKQQIREMWETLCVAYWLLCCVWLLCFVWNLKLLVLSSSLYLGLIYKMSKYLQLQKNALILWFCTLNVLKWPVNGVYRFIPQWFVIFYQNFNKSYYTAAGCTYTPINLITFGRIWQNFANWLWKVQQTAYALCVWMVTLIWVWSDGWK